MLVCNMCGRVVDESELGYVIEPHGERHKNTVCRCGENLVPATKCKICGNWFDNDGLNGVCEGCLSDEEILDNALKIGEKNTEKVDGINGFFAEALSVEQINEILTEWARKNFVDHSKAVVEYLEGDMSAFADFLEDKYREE